MSSSNRDADFLGPIPDVYERLLVPMIFQAPAESLAALVATTAPGSVLETAAGTGALTRELLRTCPDAVITATDLNQPMIDAARTRTPDGGAVTWQQADALSLPFEEASFDAVVCQFGVMFFPDRVEGYREARRVLRPQGCFAFNTWDRIENNEVTAVVQAALVAAEPAEPLVFMSRTPHGYHSPEQVRADLAGAGFTDVTITPLDSTSRTTAAEAAVAFCQGTPLRVAIENHSAMTVPRATEIAEQALLDAFGPGPIAPPIRWFEVLARP